MSLDVTGVWRQAELRVDGMPLRLSGDAIWVQAGGWYADIRTGDGPDGFPWRAPQAFAGRSGWDGPLFTWSHHIDLVGHDGPDDRSRLTPDGDVLIEVGSLPDGRTYQETWAPEPGGRGSAQAWTRGGDGVVARCGGHAVAVVRADDGTVAAAWLRLVAGLWLAAGTVGAAECAKAAAAELLKGRGGRGWLPVGEP